MESLFILAHLACAIALGFLTLRYGNGESRLFGAMAFALAIGDIFHFAPKLVQGSAGYNFMGYVSAHVAMSLCFAILHLFLAMRSGKISAASISFALAIVGTCLRLSPESARPSQVTPYIWDMLSNVPLTAQGGIMAFLFLKRRGEPGFLYMWVAIAICLAFYLPAVFLEEAAPAAKMLLLPSKLALAWIVWMGCEAATKERLGYCFAEPIDSA